MSKRYYYMDTSRGYPVEVIYMEGTSFLEAFNMWKATRKINPCVSNIKSYFVG